MTTNTIPSKAAPALQAGAELDLDFHDLLANGQAVGRTAGMVVFCFGPLPGERARVRLQTIKPKYAVGECLEITERSAERADPFCPVFGICGGCQVQHLRYPAQLAWKREIVRNALTRIGGLTGTHVRDTIGMDEPSAYRNKMSLVVDSRCDRVGFYKQRSHDVVPIDGCPIVLPQLDRHIPVLNRARAGKRFRKAFARVKHVVARASRGTGRSVLTFTTLREDPELVAAAPDLLRELPGAAGITNSYDPSGANAILGRKHAAAAGASEIEETVDGLRYRVSAGSFFQVNVEILERIFAFVRERISGAPRIVDLYCGAGTFSLYFARLGAQVLGVEESRRAVAEAKENAALNGLEKSARFVCGKVEEIVRAGQVRRGLQDADVVFLDPPRKGSDEATLEAVARARPAAVWYLSCDPATLARDLKFLAAKGYRPAEVQPFDMFPQTGHVETFVTLQPA